MDIKENIISMVRENPPIFDARHPLYKDRTYQFDTWHNIGQHVGLTGKEANKIWRNVRDRYTRLKRELKKAKKSGAARTAQPRWSYFDSLVFLNEHISHKRSDIDTFWEAVQTEFIIEEDSVILETPTSSDPDLTTTRPHKRRRRPEKNGNSETLAAMLNMLQQNNQAIADAMGANKANTDEFTAFGIMVAERLRKMEAAQSKATMRSISMMIFNDE